MSDVDPNAEYECVNCGDWIYWDRQYQEFVHGEDDRVFCRADTKAEMWPDMRLMPESEQDLLDNKPDFTLGPCAGCGESLDGEASPASRTEGMFHRRCWNAHNKPYSENDV